MTVPLVPDPFTIENFIVSPGVSFIIGFLQNCDLAYFRSGNIRNQRRVRTHGCGSVFDFYGSQLGRLLLDLFI
jgi:hypothetical protein